MACWASGLVCLGGYVFRGGGRRPYEQQDFHDRASPSRRRTCNKQSTHRISRRNLQRDKTRQREEQKNIV